MGTIAAPGAVVVGVDGSEGSSRALEWAAEHAALTRRRLLVVHGTGFVGSRPHAGERVRAERVAVEEGRGLVVAALEAAVRRHPELIAAGTAQAGHPPSVLLEQAESAALLVVGARREDHADHIIASVSLALARHAACPLVVVRPPERVPEGPPDGAPVVVGVDGTVASVDAAAFAFEYAALVRAPLLVLHGSWHASAIESAAGPRPGPPDGPPGEPRPGALPDAAEEALSVAEVIAGLPEKYPDVDFEVVHRTADPAETLVEASRQALMVVVGARRLGSAWATILMHSVSTALVEHAHCPVAVVHARP